MNTERILSTHSTMLSCLKLSLTFDPQGLKADLDQISSDEWVRHFNERYYEGEWSGIALRAVEGASTQLYSDPWYQSQKAMFREAAKKPWRRAW